MRNYALDIKNELMKEVFTFFFALELQTEITQRYTTADVDVYDSEGNKFIPINFSFGELRSSSMLAVESVSLEIDDTNLLISSLVLGEDVRNKTAIISTVVVIRTGPIINIQIQELMRGFIGGWELYEDNKAKMSITNEFVLWNKKPMRVQSSSCPWVFRDTETCRYVSASYNSCDQTYARCLQLGNEANFGGERFIMALLEKELWWGRARGAV